MGVCDFGDEMAAARERFEDRCGVSCETLEVPEYKYICVTNEDCKEDEFCNGDDPQQLCETCAMGVCDSGDDKVAARERYEDRCGVSCKTSVASSTRRNDMVGRWMFVVAALFLFVGFAIGFMIVFKRRKGTEPDVPVMDAVPDSTVDVESAKSQKKTEPDVPVIDAVIIGTDYANDAKPAPDLTKAMRVL